MRKVIVLALLLTFFIPTARAMEENYCEYSLPAFALSVLAVFSGVTIDAYDDTPGQSLAMPGGTHLLKRRGALVCLCGLIGIASRFAYDGTYCYDWSKF